MNSPFFLDLDEGTVTPMTVLAITSLEDCEHVCGQRLSSETQQSPDQCVAIAGAVQDASDLTVMKYCVPSLPSAGVRRVSEQTWTVPGTFPILNSILSVHFADLVQGNALLVVRKVDGNIEVDSSSTTEALGSTRLDMFRKGDVFLSDQATQSFAGLDFMLSIILSQSSSLLTTIHVQHVQGILVQPQTDLHKQYKQVMVHVNVMTSVSKQTTDSNGQQEFSNQRFNLCGLLHLPSKIWSARVCDTALWEEVDGRGAHVIFVRQDMLALVPGGGLLSTSDGQIHFLQLLQGSSGRISQKRYSRPFQSATWALTSGIPAVQSGADAFGFSSVTRALVRKTPMLSQVGRIREFAQGARDYFDDGVDTSVMATVPTKVTVFMSNSPSSPTHWLSEIRLDIPLTGDTTAASYMSQVTFVYVMMDLLFMIMSFREV
jgi:hypothetical protein